MPNFEAVRPWFEYGTPLVLLILTVLGAIKGSKWVGGIIRDAIFNEEYGWLSIANRNADALQKSVDSTTQYFTKLSEQEENQQELCAQHAAGLQRISEGLDQHIELSRKTLEGLEQFREDATDPNAPYSTVETNRKLDNLTQAAKLACDAAIVAARENDYDTVEAACLQIKELLS